MAAAVGTTDVVLLISLLYLGIDLLFEWDEFKSCQGPIHKWLLVSYGLVVCSRIVHMGGAVLTSSEAGAFLLDVRQKNPRIQLLMSLVWLVIFPGFTAWSAVGSFWIYDVVVHTPQCMPGGAHLWFLGIWQSLSYFWIVVHGGLGGVAWLLEKRLRRAEGELRQLEDPDLVARWGHVSQLDGYGNMPTLPGAKAGVGLTPAQILSLPGASVAANYGTEDCDCPICLNVIKAGDQVRELAGCSHCFHRSCIDLWLVRRADCPLCKGKVSASDSATHQGSPAQSEEGLKLRLTASEGFSV